MERKHTATPWKHVWGHDTHKVKRDTQGRMLGPVTMDLNDYDYALECVNAHNALVARVAELEAACEAALKLLDQGKPGWGVSRDILRAALKVRP